MKAGTGDWVMCEVKGTELSRSPSLEDCFCKFNALLMVSVSWSDSGSEIDGFGVGEMFFF